MFKMPLTLSFIFSLFGIIFILFHNCIGKGLIRFYQKLSQFYPEMWCLCGGIMGIFIGVFIFYLSYQNYKNLILPFVFGLLFIVIGIISILLRKAFATFFISLYNKPPLITLYQKYLFLFGIVILVIGFLGILSNFFTLLQLKFNIFVGLIFFTMGVSFMLLSKILAKPSSELANEILKEYKIFRIFLLGKESISCHCFQNYFLFLSLIFLSLTFYLLTKKP